MSKTVNFERSLEKSKRKRKETQEYQYRKGDLKIIEYCKNHPLDLPEGVEVHKLFYAKGEPMHPELSALFSSGIPEKGLASLKSILYGHVLSPTTLGERYEMFTHLDDAKIMSLKSEICDLVNDPFWKSIEERQKFGSYAWHGYESLIPNISQQYVTHGKNDIPEWVKIGIQRAINELPDDIELISLEESVAYCKTDTNSGFPAFTSKPFISVNEDGTSYTILNEELYNIYMSIAKTVWSGKAHTNLPAVLFKRIQPGEGYESKTRIVECVSRGILWAEARFWRPLLEAMRTIPAYAGYMHHSQGMSEIIESALDKEHVSSLDYTQYDATIGQYLPELFLGLAEKYPSAAELLRWSARYYRVCPLLTPHGWIQGEHGLFSGMFGTSFAGSLLNRGFILGMEYAINEKGMAGGKRISNPVHLAFGDDTVYAWDGSADIDDVLSILQSAGLVLNAGKQEYCKGTDSDKFVMFQACYWRFNPGGNDHCVPVYPLVRCSARLAFVEHLDSNTKLIYGAGHRVNEIDCPEVVGPIVAAFIAKLMEAENHPFIYEYVRMYQGTWLHYLNPTICVSEQHLLRFVQSEFSYIDSTDVNDFLQRPLCKWLIEGLEWLDRRECIGVSKTQLIAAATERRCGRKVHGASVDNNGDDDQLSLITSAFGHNTGLLESILLRIPQEAL